jgi:hypothetical protein
MHPITHKSDAPPIRARISQSCSEIGDTLQADLEGFDAGFAIAFSTKEAA